MNLLIFVIVLNEFSLIFYLEFGIGGGGFFVICINVFIVY